MWLIVQTNLHGHRGEYISYLLDLFQRRGEKVVIWVKQASETELQNLYSSRSNVVQLKTGEISKDDLNELRKRHTSARIVFLDGDNDLFFGFRNIAAIRRFKPIFLLMRWNLSENPSIHQRLVLFSKIALVAALRIAGRSHIKKLVFLEKTKFSFLAQVRDPLPPQKTDLASKVKLPNRVKQIGIIGTIDERKSIDIAIKAVAHLGDGYNLKLIGEVTEEYKTKLNRLVAAHGNVELRDAYLSPEELELEISILDCFLVLLRNNAPSGTLLRALDLGVPCVVGGASILKIATRKYPGLVTWAELEEEKVAKAILEALANRLTEAKSLPTPLDFSKDLIGL